VVKNTKFGVKVLRDGGSLEDGRCEMGTPRSRPGWGRGGGKDGGGREVELFLLNR